MGALHWRCKCCPLPIPESQLKSIIKHFDSDGDGLLSRQELVKAFEYLGALLPGWRARRALHHADRNGDGYVDDKELDDLVKYAFRQGYKIHAN